MDGDIPDAEGPKWRLEHASNNRATCAQAKCKSGQVKIAKGELRIGTNKLFTGEDEARWYVEWRHWGCATRQAIKGLKELYEDDHTKVPGYSNISPESQEQLREAFENGAPTDKAFKGISEDLAKVAPVYRSKEYDNAEGYKADVAVRAAACRGPACGSQGIKIAKGELRLGILVPFDGDHGSWMYKHWKCMSDYDLQMIQTHHKEDTFEVNNNLSEEYQKVVYETLDTGELVEPPPPPPPAAKAKAKKTRAKKRKVSDEDDDSEVEAPKPKRSRKKRVVDIESEDDSLIVASPKTRSRQPVTEPEETEAMKNIRALTEQMREAAAK
ncbi:glucocorticoid receptor-like (DNA-binding domain) [Pyrenochaeta sp. DS3sAY3a]|nr:glucocorticoid receptor-like (DNA-binding domain) [Pyrenochaeta sp. DS3sAY3a]